MTDESTHELLRQAADGDEEALDRLLASYRTRLAKLVRIHMDRRLAARFDPSDVVQETLMDAARDLRARLDLPPHAIYPWLRGLAMNRLIDLYRRHVLAERRSIRKERKLPPMEGSTCRLIDRFLVGRQSSPSHVAQRRETQRRLREAIDLMEPRQRDVLVMRYLEELPVEEMAEVLGVNVRTVWRWHRQALTQLAGMLKGRWED